VKQAKERQSKLNGKSQLGDNCPEAKGQARDKAGESVGVSGKLQEACERFGIEYQTAKHAVTGCRAFPEKCRHRHLSFAHHKEVANRPDAAEFPKNLEVIRFTSKAVPVVDCICGLWW
jgi:hypothetical protein